jgi:TatD DNase family protein
MYSAQQNFVRLCTLVALVAKITATKAPGHEDSQRFTYFAGRMLVDTHSHLYDASFREDWESVLQRIGEAGVEKIFLPNVDLESVDYMHDISDRYPQLFYPMMGLHPCSVKAGYKTVLENLHARFAERKYYAVGEIGIDLYWDKTFYAEQKEAFIQQTRWANELGLPVVIHSRESTGELIQILDKEIKAEKGGIFHCFSGTEDEARKIIDMGFYIGIGGVVTFKNSNLSDILQKVGLERVVLETDAPYLAPVPYRGKRNESGYVRLVAEKLATIFQLPLPEIAAVTTRNALDVFQLNN